MSIDYHNQLDAKDYEYEDILPSSENNSTVLNPQFSKSVPKTPSDSFQMRRGILTRSQLKQKFVGPDKQTAMRVTVSKAIAGPNSKQAIAA